MKPNTLRHRSAKETQDLTFDSVIPITHVDKNIDIADKNYNPLSDADRDIMEDCKSPAPKKNSYDLIEFTDDADLYDGAHVAVQIIGRRLQEEKVLALAEHIGSALSVSKSE